MQCKCNHSTDGGVLASRLVSSQGWAARGELTVHALLLAATCQSPTARTLAHHCTAGRFGLACRGWCCRITLHSASVVRLIARPCLVSSSLPVSLLIAGLGNAAWPAG